MHWLAVTRVMHKTTSMLVLLLSMFHNVQLNAMAKTITLTAKEFDLLFYLASNENIVLSRQQILDHVWEYDYESYSNLIERIH